MITFTIDLEDPTEKYEPTGRYVALTKRLLKLCDQLQRKATFFVVGRCAHAAPELMREISSKGHEIAYHSHAHVPLIVEDPKRFEQETSKDKEKIEQLIGRKVVGFRAPQFSLNIESLWVLDILKAQGFEYSSSIMPTRFSRYGTSEFPRTPFTWPNGIIELPLPVAGPLALPYLGGIYLYTLPLYLSNKWARMAKDEHVLWTYTHPYDFDRLNKFAPMANTARWVSTLLGLARFVADKKIYKVLKQTKAAPLCERIKTLKDLPQYTPDRVLYKP